jgi:Type II CAAX prenyl endopeptidase Rce1-like
MTLHSTMQSQSVDANPQPAFARRFLPVWALGLLGVLALLTQEPSTKLLEGTPALRQLPDAALRLLLLVNPLILVTVAAALGALLAHRAGLRSAVAGAHGARLDAPMAVAHGLALAAILVGADAVLADRLGLEWRRVMAQREEAPWLPHLTLGLFYGGLAEEVLLRWGLMSLMVWCLHRLLHRSSHAAGQPRDGIVWIGIAASAAVFAAGHLPALGQEVELSGAIVVRTLGLNGLAGLVYGWLFWRRSLESAMLAHATTHVGLALWRWLA